MRRCECIANYPTLDINEIKSLIAQQKPHIDLSDKYVPYNGDNSWRKRIKKEFWSRDHEGEIEDYIKPVMKLKDLLLSYGGCETCLPAQEEDLENIINHGQLWDNITTKMMKGEPSQCHGNSAELWFNNRKKYKDGYALVLCTGYALSDDGFWRQHSWLVYAKPRANVIIETTAPRIAYFGFGMTYEMADDFADEYDWIF